MNKEGAKPKDDWQQFAEDIAACVYNFASALAPDCEALKDVRRQMLQTEVRILRGLLAVAEGQMARTAPSESPRPEKIPIR